MDVPSPHYLGMAATGFRGDSNFSGDFEGALGTIQPFVERFYPVLRHYRPEVVGSCLAFAYDHPERSRDSISVGFGLYMVAGNHPQDRDSSLGSYRDDGSYLALQAYEYFEGVGR